MKKLIEIMNNNDIIYFFINNKLKIIECSGNFKDISLNDIYEIDSINNLKIKMRKIKKNKNTVIYMKSKDEIVKMNMVKMRFNKFLLTYNNQLKIKRLEIHDKINILQTIILNIELSLLSNNIKEIKNNLNDSIDNINKLCKMIKKY